MPHSRTGIFAAFSFVRMPRKLFSVFSGGRPRSMSLEPSSMMAASGLSAKAQSSRERPSALVSPDTPALTTVALSPAAFRAAWSWTGISVPGGRP
ncbi:hypothetical protein D3C83_69120 [compost metagenome]